MSTVRLEGARRLARSRPTATTVLAVSALVLASAMLRIVAGANAPGPWVFVDELIYSDLGRSAFAEPSIRGVPTGGYGYGYPALIGPAYAAFENLVAAFAAVKAVNALAMSLTAIPVFVIARTIVSRRWAIVAAGLAVVVPSMAYTGLVMTESAFYPAFAVACMLMILALRRPTVVRQLLIWPAIVVCFEVRTQGAVLAAAWLVAVVAVAVVDGAADGGRSRTRAIARALSRYWVTFLVAALACAALAAYVARSGSSLGSLLGAYSIAAEATDRYHLKPVAAWSLIHTSELALWLGVIPFAALLALLCSACMRGASRDLRVFAVASVALVSSMVLLVGAFVVFSNVGRIEERNLFYVGIFPLIALCWWVANGLPRAGRWFALVLVIAAGLPLAIPYPAVINQTAASDTFGLYVPWALSERLSDPNLTVYAVAVGAFAAAALMLFIPARLGWVLVAVVVAWFGVTSIAVDLKTDRAARGAVAQGISGPRDWIDAAVGPRADVTVVYPGGLEPLKVWQNEFFNRSVRRVMTVSVPLPGGLPDQVVYPRDGGRLYDVNGHEVAAGLVLAHDSTTIAGEVVAADAGAHMQLVRADPPLRFVDTVTGIWDDGWTGPEVIYTNFACVPGTVRTTARLDTKLHATPVTVTPYVGETQLAPVSVPPEGGPVAISVPVTPADGACQVRFVMDPTAVPSEVEGTGDGRPLGVVMARPELVAD